MSSEVFISNEDRNVNGHILSLIAISITKIKYNMKGMVTVQGNEAYEKAGGFTFPNFSQHQHLAFPVYYSVQ